MSVAIYSRTQSPEAAWTKHSTGQICQESSIPPRIDLDRIRERCPKDISDTCYESFKAWGLEYGPAFQGIEQLWSGDCESLGHIQLPEPLGSDFEDYQLHPVLLDAGFQIMIGTLLTDVTEPSKNTVYLPVGIERLRFHRQPGTQLWSHARLAEQQDNAIEGDIWLLDADGTVLVEIQGLRCQALNEGRRVGAEQMDGWFYESQWHPLQPEEVHSGGLAKRPPAPPGSWLIFADEEGVGAKLAEQLVSSGQRPVLISPGDTYCRLDESHVQIRPDRSEDMLELLRGVGSEQPSCCGVVHLWSLNTPSREEMSRVSIESAQDLGCVAVLNLLQALDQVGWSASPRLWLVTRTAQPVGMAGGAIAVAQSSLWGLGRVIVNEMPHLRCKMVDLSNTDLTRDIQLLFDELWLHDQEEEIAFREERRYAHRLSRVSIQAPELTPPECVKVEENQPFSLESSSAGILDNLILRETRRQSPGSGEIEIQVYTTGLNFRDVMKATGIYPTEGDERVQLGDECAGKVVALGEGVNDFKIGDKVVAIVPGCFSTFVTTSTTLVVPKPDHLSYEEAATIPIVFLTAYYALHQLARLGNGERVLIHAAAGGVGLAAVQIAQQVGAEIFATAGSSEKREFLRSLGVTHVMDSRSLEFADEVMTYTDGQGVDVVLNSLAGDAIPKSISILSAYGRFLEIGKRDIYQNSKLGLRPFRNNLSFFAIDLGRLFHDRPMAARDLLQDVMEWVENRKLHPLPHRVFPISEAVSAFRYMAQAKHIGKIVLALRDPEAMVAPAAESVVPFRSDGTYLITGGLGGLGLAVAQWMVEQGARHLVLIGRSGVSSREAEQALETMQQAGAQIVVAQADVVQEQQVANVLADIERSMPPLRGVIHAAMVLDDGFLFQLNRERLERVMAPKVMGAWNLHTQTLTAPLDFFVLFSSVTSLIGNPGQGNYVAANAFLDALAHYRRAQRLPALSINWGAIAGVGYVARHDEIRQHLERQGLVAFTPKQAVAILEHGLRHNPIQLGAMNIDWSKWGGFLPQVASSPRLSHLLQADLQDSPNGHEPRREGDSVLNKLLSTNPDERLSVLETYLCEHIARILETSASKLDTDQPLTTYGLDSIMAVEMSHWIGHELGVEVPTVALMQTPSIAQLATQILDQLSIADAAPEAAPSLPDVDQLSDEEVDAMLRNLLVAEESNE